MILAIELKNHILQNNPKAKTGNLQSWAAEFDKMLRLDNRTVEEIKAVMEFSQTDTFWRTNVLSAKKMRDKFDTLYLQNEQRITGQSKNRGKGSRSNTSESLKVLEGFLND